MTDAERQQRSRTKRRAAGLVRIEAWVPAHAEAAVRAAIEQAVEEADRAGKDE
jgi:hypothetical protein